MEVCGCELLEQLREGSRSITYRAKRCSDGLRVVLKVLREHHPSQVQLASLQHEDAILRGLEVEGVVRSYGVEEEGGRAALLLEDFGGESLKVLHGARRLSIERTVTLAVEVVSILETIHQRGVVHQDLNPTNLVMRPSDGKIKIVDFGLASLLPQHTSAFTSPVGLKGTLAYMSPEQTGRMNRPVDYRTDYYSLGVSLYELLTGHLPFTSEDAVELVHAHIARQPPPPRTLNAELPEVLATIVLKLMAKSADDRYQSARGIRADLIKCLDQLREGEEVAPFSIARRDRPTQFRIAEKLYGRDADVQKLVAAFERSIHGTVLMLVSGHSGIGKSSLIREVYRPITARRGNFIAGKFDQYRHEDPHAALKQAFRELVEQLFTESEERLAAIRGRAKEVLGANARILTDIYPGLDLLLGQHPAVLTLPPLETRHRFNQAVTRFLACVATPEHPLCIFFDDLQWANADALKLLEHMSHADQDLPLFIIGAYRDEEVLDAHALALTLRSIEAHGARVERLALRPLGLAETKWMVADTLAIAPEEGADLAELLLARTAGNPFFVRAFFSSLHADGLIEPHPEGYQWSVDRIRQRGVTDNLVDLMTARLRQLRPETQEVLTVAACLGGMFDLGTLALVTARTLDEVSLTLWGAVAEGLVLVVGQVSSAAQMVERGPELHCRFAHDRIQQAALSVLGEEARARLSRKIGGQLARARDGREDARRLFDIVGLLNEGRSAMDDREEVVALAGLNLEAARKARDNAASQQALEYGRVGITLLDEDDWEARYELARDLHLTAVEAAFSCGDVEAARELSDAARPKLRGVLDEVRLLSLDGQVLFSQQRIHEALQTYLTALERLGCGLPASITPGGIEDEFQRTVEGLKAYTSEALEGLGECRDPVASAAMFLLSQVISCAGVGGASVYPIAVSRLVSMSLRCGVVRQSSFGYATFGSLLLLRNEIEEAYRLGLVALRMADRGLDSAFRAQTYYVAAFHLMHVKRPPRDIFGMFRDAHRFALEGGSPFFAAAALEALCVTRFFAGEDLTTLSVDLEQGAQLIAKLQQPMVLVWQRIYVQRVLNLLGKSAAPMLLCGPAYVEEDHVPRQLAAGDAGGMFHYHESKMHLCYLFGDHEQAVTHADALARYPVGAEHSVAATAIAFTQALSYLAVYERADEAERERLLGLVEGSLRKLERWLEHCPATYEHKLLLLRAERARVLGAHDTARAAFARGTELADKSGYQQEAALGHELAGRFYGMRGDHKLARQHLRNAHERFLRWGAIAKAKQLEREHPGIVPLVASSILTASKVSDAAGRELDFNVLDLVSVLNASQDLSREIELDRLLARLMQVLLETSGAAVGYLLLEQDGQWVIEGEKTVTQEDAVVLKSIPLAELGARGHRGLPVSLIYYVARTQESVVLDDAAASPRFGGDPYISEHAVGSVLCFSLGRTGGRRGIVYLENSLTRGAFTPARIRILQMLSTQAVISIENAGLYNTLEQRVEARTLELQRKNEELAAALKRLREAQDRMVVQERLASLGSLAAGIAHELRNPLNFVTNFADFSAALVDEIGGEVTGVYEKLGASRSQHLGEALEDLKGNVKRISEHGRRMEGIIRSMLDHSRDDRGARQHVDINALVETYVHIGYRGTRARISAGAMAIDVRLDPAIGLVRVVPQELSRVIINLVDNACYSVGRRAAQGEAGFEPRIQVSTHDEGAWFEIRVRDNGSGIAAVNRDKVFNPFFTTKPPGEGTGLGLSICHNIITEGNGGVLRFESEEGTFAEFIVRLPKRPQGGERGHARDVASGAP
ncbi:trifunctional serine/threonine-protein kinase/ATP-binding protein/sensor histidine kinase [Chondromyces apiculatus]|uniref:histidine kinase n=1 Tax=Chondromyces apiculatus DSM 436 TaxID=1192034 RepID=A0A017T957_9BACT|nr:trifunctional serine/threonine-protein kinase/ATP-binding protein/sensor histidine kinase [Chondromyces apiculatus]EYF05774.1 Hypothetical protein CAP_3064 [Chondromyces apiculatus DSM 436]